MNTKATTIFENKTLNYLVLTVNVILSLPILLIVTPEFISPDSFKDSAFWQVAVFWVTAIIAFLPLLTVMLWKFLKQKISYYFLGLNVFLLPLLLLMWYIIWTGP